MKKLSILRREGYLALLGALVLSLVGFSVMVPKAVAASGPITWSTSVVVSSNNGPAWGRMLPNDQKGDTLITYTEYPANGTPIIKVARSNAANPAWTEIASIPSPTDHGGHIQEQSQMVQLPDGTILMAMRNRQTDLNWFGLPIVKSTDGGYTWTYVSQLDTNPNSNGQFNRGLWEPFLSVLPNGCVAGFYANEKHADDNPSYSQIVSERVSCNEGQTWGPEIYAAAQPGSARPGMPGFARMANGQYILVFEVCGTDNCNIHYKISRDGTTWSNDLGTRLANQVSGPYVTVLSTGRILVTSANTNQISVSDDNGASWYFQSPPAWSSSNATWPAIYQTATNQIGVVVNLNGAIQIKYGTGVSAVGGDSGVPAAPGASAAPTAIPTAEWWITTFANAPGYRGGFTQDGTLYAGTSYVFCKEWGANTSDNNGNFNHWWFWTDLDTGGQGWVSAYYLSLWGNDQALDNNGNVIPNCPGV